MTLTEIKAAVERGETVFWANKGYRVVKDTIGQWFVIHSGGHCIGLTWNDGVTMNGKESEFFVA